MTKQHQKNQLLILLIFSMTIIPFLIALVLQQYPQLLNKPANKGQLIIPPIATELTDFKGVDTFSSANIGELTGHWLIANVITDKECNSPCLEAVLKTKQLRLMLNKELPRTRRIVLITQTLNAPNAAQYWLKDSLLWRARENNPPLFTDLLKPENQLTDPLISQLIGTDNKEFALHSDLIRLQPSEALVQKLTPSPPNALTTGMLLLIDPLGNIMMRYPVGFDVYHVKNDLMHLLRVSQIG